MIFTHRNVLAEPLPRQSFREKRGSPGEMKTPIPSFDEDSPRRWKCRSAAVPSIESPVA
jgi:hypothetical protein